MKTTIIILSLLMPLVIFQSCSGDCGCTADEEALTDEDSTQAEVDSSSIVAMQGISDQLMGMDTVLQGLEGGDTLIFNDTNIVNVELDTVNSMLIYLLDSINKSLEELKSTEPPIQLISTVGLAKQSNEFWSAQPADDDVQKSFPKEVRAEYANCDNPNDKIKIDNKGIYGGTKYAQTYFKISNDGTLKYDGGNYFLNYKKYANGYSDKTYWVASWMQVNGDTLSFKVIHSKELTESSGQKEFEAFIAADTNARVSCYCKMK